MKAIADRAQGTWDKFRKERDFHRMHHKRVVQVRELKTSIVFGAAFCCWPVKKKLQLSFLKMDVSGYRRSAQLDPSSGK